MMFGIKFYLTNVLVKSLQNFMGGSVSVILIRIVKTTPCTEVQGYQHKWYGNIHKNCG